MLASKLTPRILVENGKKERASDLLVCVLRLRESRVSTAARSLDTSYILHFVHKRTSNTIIIIISNQFISLSSHEFVLL